MKLTIRIYNRNPVHTRLSVWVNGALIISPGGICLRNEEVFEFIQRLKPNNFKEVIKEFNEIPKKNK